MANAGSRQSSAARLAAPDEERFPGSKCLLELHSDPHGPGGRWRCERKASRLNSVLVAPTGIEVPSQNQPFQQ